MLRNAVGTRRSWALLPAGIVAAVVTVTLALAFAALRDTDAGAARTIAVTLGSLVSLASVALPLALGADDPMHPAAFAPHGVERRGLATSLAVAGLLGPSSLVVVLAVAQVVTWNRSAVTALVALLAAALIVVTAVLATRIALAIGAVVLDSRRARGAVGLAAMAGAVLLLPAVALLVSLGIERATELLDPVAAAAAWTPLGAAWAAPADAAVGDDGVAVARLALAAGYAAVLWVGWHAVVAAFLSGRAHGLARRDRGGLGWFGILPSTPLGAVAARSLTYWVRDRRYWVHVGVLPVVPALVVGVLLAGGVPASGLALLPLPMMALFLGWAPHNDVAFDGTALWMHVASPARGMADRIGRLVPAVVLGVPLVVFGAPLSARLHGDESVTLPLAALATCLILAGLGVSSVFSAVFPYPAPRPGDSPFARPQSSAGSGAFAQALSFLLPLLLSTPALAFLLSALLGDPTRRDGRLDDAVTLGFGVGIAVLAIGLALGAGAMQRRGSELLAFAQRV